MSPSDRVEPAGVGRSVDSLVRCEGPCGSYRGGATARRYQRQSSHSGEGKSTGSQRAHSSTRLMAGRRK